MDKEVEKSLRSDYGNGINNESDVSIGIKEGEYKKILEEIDRKSVEDLWDEIGFHKPLAGFWYRIAFYLISMIIGLVFLGFYYRIFYPYPESMGYRNAATGIFVLFFALFDLGTHRTMDRFIAEMRIKNPNVMVKYIQYFIWYQMMTGIIQTTAVSMYALFTVPRTDLAYAAWIMLIYSTTQYPGFLGVFRGVLNSLQHFDKTEILNFISGEVFQRATEMGFVLLGRWWGTHNPAIGELMGITIGSVIGLYADDFIATLFSAYWFQKVMKNQNIKVRDCFRIEFDSKLFKETFIFGVKTGMPDIIGLAVSLIILLEWLAYVPQYTTFVSLHGMAQGIAGLVNEAMGIRLSMLISESFLNDRVRLTEYYIGQTIRFSGQIQAFMLTLVMIIYTLLPSVFPYFGLQNYVLAIPFIIPSVIRNLQQPLTSLADEICLGTNHPTWLMSIRFAEEIMKVFWMTLWIVWLRLPERYGLSAIVWIMPCGIYPAIIMKTTASYIFIQKKIINIRAPWWQAFGASYISAAFTFLIGWGLKLTVFDYFFSAGLILPGALIMLGAVIMLAFCYFGFTALLGGWDRNTLVMFKKAAKMSGPSKFLVMPLYKVIELCANISYLHDKFGMDAADAENEARELLVLKHIHDVRNI